MVEYIEGLPDRYDWLYPYADRPRSKGIYGVTEVLYCLRKNFLTRVVPAPTAIAITQRKLFSRGHALEAVAFGPDRHNPEYFVGDGRLTDIEGHSDHIVRDDDDKIVEIVEFKSTRKIWFSSPNGKVYYTITAAKNATSKEDWGEICRKFSESHMDQLKVYMTITGAPTGVLIYYEMTTDNNYTWVVTSDEITDEFKENIYGRLDRYRYSMDNFVVPAKEYAYKWECSLCSFNRNSICTLCDQEGFDLKEFCDDVEKGKYNNKFDSMVEKYRDKYNVIPMTEVAQNGN